MKTIEERAKEMMASSRFDVFCWQGELPQQRFNPRGRYIEYDLAAKAVSQVAKGVCAELTRWNNPFVKNMPKDNVLVKYIAVGCPNEPYYTIGRREPSGEWDCENDLATSPRFEIIGWRPIHE